jgi:hypothetical protein
MKKWTMIGIALLTCLAATAAFAAQDSKDQRLDLKSFLDMNRVHGPAFSSRSPLLGSRSLFEGFEGGAIPSGWVAGVTNPGRTWGVSGATSTGALEGGYCAFVGYDLSVLQDETLSFNQTVDVAGGASVLSFWMAGSRTDDWSGNVAETVEIDGATVFDFDSATSSQFVWEKFFVDLGAYDGQTVTVTFRYRGVDGDLHVLDAVTVDDGTGYEVPPPPPPPANDLCAGAVDLQEQSLTAFDLDLCLYADDYTPGVYGGSCTGWSANGPDATYKIHLGQGESFTVCETPTSGYIDLAIYAVTDCADAPGTCLAGDDSGNPECISFVAPATGWYYLIVDAYSGCGMVTVTIDSPVANDAESWGAVKAIYK